MPEYHYIASVAFDEADDETARRQWLADMRADLLTRIALPEDFDEHEMLDLPPSETVLDVVFHANQTPSIRRSRMAHVADKLEYYRLGYPGDLPDLISFKWRMA